MLRLQTRTLKQQKFPKPPACNAKRAGICAIIQHSQDSHALLTLLPQMMLTAEMEGVPTQFSRIRLERDLARLDYPLRDLFEVPIELFDLDALPEPSGNLLPSAWRADTYRLERSERIKQRLLLGVVVYLVAIAVSFVYLAWLNRQSQTIAAQYAAARPVLDQIAKSERRWNDLRQAIDPHFYTVEILFQARRNLPSKDVRLTEFIQSGLKWTLVGEAPSANLAIEYAEKLKSEKELDSWTIVPARPDILKGEQAKFTIEGKP